MKKFEYIFIDLDGPILDGKYRHYQCYKNIILTYGGVPLSIDEYWNMKRNMVKRTVLLHKSGFCGTYGEFMKMWLENIEKEEYLKYDILKPRVLESLKNIKNYTENLLLVTMRNNKKNLLRELENLQLSDSFDQIIICSSISENPKYQALKSLKFDHAIFIGDTEEDVNTAKKLHIPCIGITNGLRESQYLDADYFVDEISDINFESMGIISTSFNHLECK